MKLTVSVVMMCFFVESFGERDENDFDEILKEIAAANYPRGRRGDLVGRTVMSLLTGRGTELDRVKRDDQMVTDTYDPCREGQYEPYAIPSGQFGLARGEEDARHMKPLGGIGFIDHYEESIVSPLHEDKLYTAVIPIISGYKMSPIIAYKKVIFKDDKLGLFKDEPAVSGLGSNKDLAAPGFEVDSSSDPAQDTFRPASPPIATEISANQPQPAAPWSGQANQPIPANQFSTPPIPLTRIVYALAPVPEQFQQRRPQQRHPV